MHPRISHLENTRGSAPFAALLVGMVLTVISLAMLSAVVTTQRESREEFDDLQAQYVAEAGLRFALTDLSGAGTGSLGTEANPVVFGAGTYWSATTDNLDTTYTVQVHGRTGATARSYEALVRRMGGAFANAIYAGNDSGDPNYTLEFGGTGTQADEIHGDIFSGGNLTRSGDAIVDGQVGATGTLTGISGTEGATQAMLDIATKNYEVNHDINVADEFTASEVWQYDDGGGNAFQLPEEIPSHIFRKNRDDRATQIASTVKDDYYLEDPYELPRNDPNWDGTDAHLITMTGSAGKPGPDTNSMVFYIDGNLWIDGGTYSYKFLHDAALSITIVASGNIYISDNLFYGDPVLDAVALIAIEDPAVADSGNIYFGDPSGGTLETMYAYMYAENDFVDYNLDSAGSDNVILHGTMSAGNQVRINRDFANQYTKFVMNFDARLRNGQVNLPGLPAPTEAGEVTYVVLGVRSIAAGGP